MANALKSNGTNYAVSSTLGNILNFDTLEIIVNNFFWPAGSSGTLFSQGVDNTNDREFSFYSTSGVFAAVLGGEPNNGIYSFSGDLEGTLRFILNVQASTMTMIINATTLINAAPVTIGSSRVSGTPFRLLARGAGGDATGGYLAPDLAQYGDTEVYINGVISRNFIMPDSGSVIPDTEAGQAAMVYGSPINWVTIDAGSVLKIRNTNNLPATGDVQVYAHLVSDKSVSWEGLVSFTDGAADISLPPADFPAGATVHWGMIDPVEKLSSMAEKELV